jgi:glycine C-acetyltransferase
MHPALADKVQKSAQRLQQTTRVEPYFPVVDSAAVSHITMRNRASGEQRRFLNFTSSNYLGLGQHPEVREAVERALAAYGLGANGSPVLGGYFEVHQRLERELAELHEFESAMLFCGGLAANVGVVSGLAGPGDVVLLDQSAHGSLVLGARASGAELRFYRHQDFDELKWLLERFAAEKRMVLLGVMGVYSMTGEIENVPAIIELARAHGAVVVLDDAHALGVLGQKGTGTLEHFGLPHDAVDVHVGTLSKTLAGAGGYVAAPRAITEHLRFNSSAHMFTASMPPAVAAGCLAALDLLRREGGELSARLRRKAELFRAALRAQGVDARGELSGIIPVHLPDERFLWDVNQKALERGVFLSPVVFPGVPKGQGRLRFGVTLTHEDADLQHGAAVVGACVRECLQARELAALPPQVNAQPELRPS